MLLLMENVTLGYDYHPAVHHVSGKLDSGCIVGLMGPNGGGKSSLLKGIKGELTPSGGTITRMCDSIGFLTQKPVVRRECPISVRETITSGLWREIGWFARVDATLSKKIEQTVVDLQLEDLIDKNIGELSEGQFRRVLLARLMVEDAPLYLLDEPFDNLDGRGIEALLKTLHRWKKEGKSAIVSLHNFDLAEKIADEIIFLARELIVWDTPSALKKNGFKEQIISYRVRQKDHQDWCLQS